jgi:hypothetical protein
VAELHFGVVFDIGLRLVSVPLVVTGPLARGADGERTAQLLDAGNGFTQLSAHGTAIIPAESGQLESEYLMAKTKKNRATLYRPT